jgi:hypothetical protein
MTKMLKSLEPFIDPVSKTMNVGGIYTRPTNILTALLFGFSRHTELKEKEYYFWRICDELWNRPDLPKPMMTRHTWSEEMIRAAILNDFLSIGGAASSSKSHTMAAWGIVNWLSRPADTLVLITSTTLRESRKRIWGSVISLMSVIDDAPCKVRDSIGSIAYINEKGTLFDRAGLSLVASDKSKGATQNTKLLGSKQNRVLVIGDELSELSPTIIATAISNMSKNPYLQVIGMSNPGSRFDAFGDWSEPEGGWDSVDIQTADNWKTKWGGQYIRLDGERSPNIIAGETLYDYLPTEETLRQDKSRLGPDSRAYMRMVRAVFFDEEESEGIYSEAELTSSGSMRPAEWATKPITVAGLDPAFTNGGDRCVLFLGKVGYLTNGQFGFEFGRSFMLSDDARNTAIPRTYQIVKQVVDICVKNNVDPENLAVDATGAGAPFCDVLAGEWSSSILRVGFGGRASDRRVSANSKLKGDELYVNRSSELWFVGKELIRTKQLFGVTNELAIEMVARKYDMTKSTTLKVKIESKPEFKVRFGRSPDLADAAFLALDCARQRHGLLATEPYSESDALKFKNRPTRSVKYLKKSLDNDSCQLIAE